MIAIYCRKCVGPLALGLVCWSESRKALSRAIPCASSRFGRPPAERYSSENGKEQAPGHRTTKGWRKFLRVRAKGADAHIGKFGVSA
jgi:hypothetical protein